VPRISEGDKVDKCGGEGREGPVKMAHQKETSGGLAVGPEEEGLERDKGAVVIGGSDEGRMAEKGGNILDRE